MRVLAFVGGLSALAACDPTVVKQTCLDLLPREYNETGLCLGPPVMDTGVQVCALGAPPTDSDLAVCMVGPDGRIFRAAVAPATTIRAAAGWTHSEYPGAASTLSAADATRCAAVLPADAGAIPTCP